MDKGLAGDAGAGPAESSDVTLQCCGDFSECCFPGVGKPERFISYVGLLDVWAGGGQDLSP